ncbi:Phosphoinositide phosphatase [Vigna angularis]|uniref:Phosphoinositide phosphatase n=1 Tax=Phaseolus angularis TaxID=3914 RepID=A0A8T0JLF9_PHAAN|nr:Phosphoinositide phosphatase [Vigna angularis]
MMEKADSVQKLYTRMRLWAFPDQFVIEPTDGSSGSSLAVSRVDGSMKLIDEVPECSSLRVPKIYTIFGVVGMLRLLAGSYLLVITERESVGSYLGHPIFKISSLKVFPCDNSLKNTPAEQKKIETEFSALLNVAEKSSGLFFSYETNLTLSAQRLNDLGDESRLLPLWRQAEPRFLWNNYMLEVLIDNKVGTRMWRRGADPDGYVANFVETEQIMQFNGYTASFVQVRGSIPLLWQQIVDLTYKPKFELLKLEEAPRVLERHFLDLRKKYGAVLVVDLVNTHVASNDVRFSGKKRSMIGRNMLEYQLRRLGVFGAEETISSHPNLDESFKISLETRFLTDSLWFGHRTVQGIVQDGCNALLRYYYNNFRDGTKQDAIDLIQGHYIVSVSRDTAASSQKGGLEAIASFPMAFALVLTGFLFATMSLRQVQYDFRHFFFSLMWAGISVGIAAFVRANGRVFCNRPRLHNPR